MRFARTKPSIPRRRAFTLTEILVVIAIIVIIVGLTAAGYFYFIGSQQGHNTEGTIRTVNKVFQSQWSYVVEQAKKESPSQAVKDAATNANTVPDPGGARAQVLWIKLRLIEAFPISFSEINNPADPIYILLAATIPASQRKNQATYQRLTKGLMAAKNSNTESSACLLMALSVSRGGSALPPDQLGSFVVDTDGDGIKEIVDAWQQPLAFYRFAWNVSGGTPDIQGLNPAPAGSKGARLGDPLDPAGTLLAWPAGAARKAYGQNIHAIADASGNNANYVIPVIVSAGPDLALGLTATTSCATGGCSQTGTQAKDNIYSFNLRGN